MSTHGCELMNYVFGLVPARAWMRVYRLNPQRMYVPRPRVSACILRIIVSDLNVFMVVRTCASV